MGREKDPNVTKRILITGGGGFLGRYVLEQCLEKGHQVGNLARGDYPFLEQLSVTQHRGSLEERRFVFESVEGYDAVIHVAAKAGFWGRRDDFWGPNVRGTENLVEACIKHGIRQFVFTSSPSVIFSGAPQSGCDESLPYPDHFESPYPESKAASEKLVLDANCESFMTCSLRPHLIFGPRDPHLLPKVLQRAATGNLIQVGPGTNRVDLTYVEDAARAHLLALERLTPGSPVCGSSYFITQDEPVELWPWVGSLLKELRLPPIKKRIPLGLGRAIGGFLEVSHRILSLQSEPRLTRFLASELAQDHFYNIEKAKTELDYQPGFNMAEALEKTLPFLRTLF